MVRKIEKFEGLNKSDLRKATYKRKAALKQLCDSMGVNPLFGELFLSEIKLDWDNERDWLKQRIKLLGLW